MADRSALLTPTLLFTLLAGGLALLTHLRMPVVSAERLAVEDVSAIASRYLPPADTDRPPSPAAPPKERAPCPEPDWQPQRSFSVVLGPLVITSGGKVVLVRTEAQSNPPRILS